ncbi:MAG TPA: cytochrome P460 family protein [Vicinamibacterales bacterium]
MLLDKRVKRKVRGTSSTKGRITMKRLALVLALTLSIALVSAFALNAEAPSPSNDDGPQLNGTTLTRPANYREWIFLSAGLGMSYSPAAADTAPPFDNVFVNPSAYRQFLKTGTWPDRTVLVLELRSSQDRGSINQSGHFQTTRRGMEVHVKDARLPGGWAFFQFPEGHDTAVPLSGKAGATCLACHTDHGAVDQTFVQFYPTLIDVARARGTYKPN